MHNLTELLVLCAQQNGGFQTLMDQAATLNPFYTETRYPVHWPMGFTREDAVAARTAATDIAEVVKDNIC